MRNERILIIGVNYWPESTGIGPYTTGFAEQLARAGASVTVATAVPHYPMWRVPDEFRTTRAVEAEHNGVRVRRVAPWIPPRMTAFNRARFEASFGRRVRSVVADVSADAVVAVVPSLAGALVARLYARRRAVPLGVIFQDLMGRSAEQSGMAGRRVARMTAAVEASAARAATRVGVVSEGFRSFLCSSGVPVDRIEHLPNWSRLPRPTRSRAAVRERFGWPDDKTIVLHAGNMGAKQALDNVIDAAALPQATRADIRFVLMGDGSRRAALEDRGRALPNLQFLPPQPDDIFPDVLAAADLLLVNERATVRDMSLPSKLTSYFVAGRPVVAAVRPDGTTAAELERSGAGLIVAPGDPEALVLGVLRLASDNTFAAALASRGRTYATDCLSEPAAARRSVQFVERLFESPKSASAI